MSSGYELDPIGEPFPEPERHLASRDPGDEVRGVQVRRHDAHDRGARSETPPRRRVRTCRRTSTPAAPSPPATSSRHPTLGSPCIRPSPSHLPGHRRHLYRYRPTQGASPTTGSPQVRNERRLIRQAAVRHGVPLIQLVDELAVVGRDHAATSGTGRLAEAHMIRAAQPASWWPVGSSAMRSRGAAPARVRARSVVARRAYVSFGYLDRSSVNPSAPIRSSITERCSASTPAIRAGYSTFSCAESSSIRPRRCGIIAMSDQIRRPVPRRVHRPRVRRLPASGDVQQRGLSGPRAADQADDLTGARFEAHSSERMHGLVALAVRLVDVHQPHDGLVVEPPDRAVRIRPPQLRCRRDVRRMRRIMGRPADAAVFQLEPFVGHRHHGRFVFASRNVTPSAASARTRSSTPSLDASSSSAVGSSATMMLAPVVIAWANAARCCSPPTARRGGGPSGRRCPGGRATGPDRVRWNRGHVSRDADALRRSDAPRSCPRDVGRCSRRGHDGGVAAPSPIRDRRRALPRRASPRSANPCRRSSAGGTIFRFRTGPRSPSRHLGGTGT